MKIEFFVYDEKLISSKYLSQGELSASFGRIWTLKNIEASWCPLNGVQLITKSRQFEMRKPETNILYMILYILFKFNIDECIHNNVQLGHGISWI